MAGKIGKFGAEGLIVILACGVTSLITWQLDNDAWFILNCGRYVLETGTIPHVEFATMHEGFNYVMEQWLTAVIFWKVFSNYGADGLIAFVWLSGFILMVVYYRLCIYVSGGNKKVSAMLTVIISAVILVPFFVTRPQIFSTLLLLTEIFLLERFVREKKFWLLGALPILAILFINLHAAIYPMMTIILLPYIAESLYQKIKPARKSEIPLLPLILTAAGIFAAGFLNPYGVEAMTFIFDSYSPEVHGGIQELNSTSVSHSAGVAFFIFCGFTVISYCKKNLPVRYFFLQFGIMILGFYALRNLLLFFILATFPLAFALKDWHPFDKIFNLPHKLFIPLFLLCIAEFYRVYILAENSIWTMHLPVKIILALTVIFLVCFIFFYRKEGKLFSEEIFILRRKPLIALAALQGVIVFAWTAFTTPAPKYELYKPAAEFLLSKNRAEDIILWTGFNGGGYFEFHGIKTYMDARPELFTLSFNKKKEVAREYLALRGGDLDYKEFFARYNFTHIFITTEDIIPYLLVSQDKNFKLIFEYDFPDGSGHGRIFLQVKK